MVISLLRFSYLTYSQEKLVDFLIQHGVFASTIKCDKCGNKININKERLIYLCMKEHYVINRNRKRVLKQCQFYKSVRTDTWFNKSRLTLGTTCKIVACFLMLGYPRQDITQSETCVSSGTIVDWFNYCREVCVFWAEKYSEKLGGPGHIVEIDEAKIGKRKYNRGRLVKGRWIFGGYERDTNKIFIVPVENRSEKTFLACIKKWILPGTTIISDCWKSYNCLNTEGYQHLTVNHSYNFVDPKSGAHTQHTERVWREVRANIPRYGTRNIHTLRYLCEFLFKRVHTHLTRIEKFFDVIAEMCPLRSTLEDQSETFEEPSTSTS